MTMIAGQRDSTTEQDLDERKECVAAEYATVDGLNKLQHAFSKAALFNQALEAGLPGITPEIVKEADEAPARILKGICETYSRAAVRAGSIEDRHDLPQIFRNESKESPGDKTVIEKMALARGQELNNEQPPE
jgi:hypothetical protein